MHAFSACKNVLAKFQTSAHFYSLYFAKSGEKKRDPGNQDSELHSSNGLIEVVLG